MPDDAMERARLEATTLRMLLAASGTNLTAEAGGMINRAFASFAAFASQQAPEGWRPIDTAPKDGTQVDLWVEPQEAFLRHRIPNASWREPSDSEWWVHGGDTIDTPDATWHDDFGPLGKSEQPTHWRPLPAPPAMLDAAPSVTLGEVG